jgi:hypothetical protein
LKKITVAALFALGSFLTAASALAQSRNEIRVNVPFAFVVGGKVLPAGNYRIDSETSQVSANEVLIQNVDQPRYSVLVRGTDGSWEVLPTSAVSHGHLVFNQYGDDRFLRQVRAPWAAVNVDVPKSRAEQHVQKREQTTQTAYLAIPTQTTIELP